MQRSTRWSRALIGLGATAALLLPAAGVFADSGRRDVNRVGYGYSANQRFDRDRGNNGYRNNDRDRDNDRFRNNNRDRDNDRFRNSDRDNRGRHIGQYDNRGQHIGQYNNRGHDRDHDHDRR